MNWDDLKVVLAIHRAGSISGGAKLLQMDASTAGRRLLAIERDLDAVLFSRAKSGLTATDIGLITIEHALQIERRAERIVERLPGRETAPAGSVRLISNPWILTQLAAFGLQRLRSDYPEIELILIASTRRRGIGAGETDLALWFEVPPEEGEFAIPLGDVRYALYAPVGSDPDEMEWMSIWNTNHRIDPMRWLSRYLPADRRIALKCNDPPALLGAVAAGLGKALLPTCMGDRDSRVMRVHGDMPEFERRLHLHAHPDLVQSARIQAVMAWVRGTFPLVFGDQDNRSRDT